MRNIITLSLIAALSLGIAACGKPDRKLADKKLEAACSAAVKALFPTDDTLEFKNKTFSDDKAHDGHELRKVHLVAHYVRDGGLIEQKTFDCWFEESSGMKGSVQKFYRITSDGQNFGNFDGTMSGDLNEFLKAQEAADAVLR